jgi:hypothetical protein
MNIKGEELGFSILALRQQIATLTAERDEARREVCVWQGLDTGSTPRNTATVRGWDCFKDDAP